MKTVVDFRRPTSADKPAQLAVSERLLLLGFRMVARHRGCNCPIAVSTRRLYSQFQVEDCLGPLDTLIETFAGAAHTAIEIHSPSCPCVSESEALLLRTMAATQSADLDTARRGFECWLPRLEAERALGAASEIARMFQVAGMILPLRDGVTIETVRAAATPSWVIGSRAVH